MWLFVCETEFPCVALVVLELPLSRLISNKVEERLVGKGRRSVEVQESNRCWKRTHFIHARNVIMKFIIISN